MSPNIYFDFLEKIKFALIALIVGIILLLVLPFISGCSPRIVESVKMEYKDSVRIEVHERLVHDTVSVEIPVIIEKNVTKADSSHLENKYAKSDAVIRDGLLFHTLETKPQVIEAPVVVAVADTTTTHTSEKSEAKEKTIEKPLTWLQNIKLSTWWIFFAASIGLGGWTFRKPLFAAIKKLII